MATAYEEITETARRYGWEVAELAGFMSFALSRDTYEILVKFTMTGRVRAASGVNRLSDTARRKREAIIGAIVALGECPGTPERDTSDEGNRDHTRRACPRLVPGTGPSGVVRPA